MPGTACGRRDDRRPVLTRLIPRALRRASSVEAPLPRATRPLFAVGDVHGMADLLDTMIRRIGARIARERLDDATVVFLGDHIDRGPQSRETLDLLLDAPVRLGVETVFLRGNHESFATRFLNDPAEPSRWLDWGGDTTVESYGVDPQDYAPDPAGRIALATAVTRAMGPAHLDFLNDRLVSRHDAWPHFFAHAGVDAARAPGEQTRQALIHGTRGFRQTGGWPGSLVVHGHTISDTPDFGPCRLGIDTGAYRSGRLTAAFFRGDAVEFIEAGDA